jgi:hypothetical protein
LIIKFGVSLTVSLGEKVWPFEIRTSFHMQGRFANGWSVLNDWK